MKIGVKCDMSTDDGSQPCGNRAVARVIGLGSHEWINVCADCGRKYANWLEAEYNRLKGKADALSQFNRETLYSKWKTVESDIAAAQQADVAATESLR